MSKFEKPFPLGRGWGRLPPLQKSNNFESFFSDSTLTFLTYRNTFLLPILPTRRIIFLCLPLILICLPQIFLSLPLSKTKRRVGKIGRRKVFLEVKNVNIESPKKTLKIVVFFGALLPLSSPSMLMNGFIKAAFNFWGARIDFWNTN